MDSANEKGNGILSFVIESFHIIMLYHHVEKDLLKKLDSNASKSGKYIHNDFI